MRNAPKKTAQSQSPEAIAAEINRLGTLPPKELKGAWAAEFGRPPPKSLWPELLLRMLAWRIQETAFGGHDKALLRLLAACRQKRAGDQRAQRLKAGTILVREFGGTRHTVTIVPEGFLWQDKTYPSLTAIARIITGTSWNGPRFFGLRDGESRMGDKRVEKAV
jgi:hypothetical protein